MPSGATQEKTHDALGRLTRIEAKKADSTAINRYDYQYNAAGQRSQLTLLDGEVRTFGYNEKRELTSADSDTDAAYDFAYNFDLIGNREQSTTGGASTTYASNSVNQYSQISDGVPVSPAHDDNGSLTDDGTRELVWNEANRLVEVRNTLTSQRVEYLYDGLGRRIERKVYDALTGGNLVSETRQLYSVWHSLMDVDGNNAELETRTWGLDIANATSQTGGVGALLARRRERVRWSREDYLQKLGVFKSEWTTKQVLDEVERCREMGAETRLDEIAESVKGRLFDLSMFMKELKLKMTLAYNKKHGRCGTLWEGPFKSVLLQGARRKDGGSKMRGAQWGDLRVLRDLKAEVIQ